MKKSLLYRAVLIPLAGSILTSCETSGQLLTGGVCACLLVGVCAFAGLVSFTSTQKSAAC